MTIKHIIIIFGILLLSIGFLAGGLQISVYWFFLASQTRNTTELRLFEITLFWIAWIVISITYIFCGYKFIYDKRHLLLLMVGLVITHIILVAAGYYRFIK